MSEALRKAKEEVLYACKTICSKGYVLGTAGNISAIVEGEDLFVITPSSYPYDIMTEEDLVVSDMEGNIVEGFRKPSIEFSMHRYIYLKRPDVKAIVHSHSPYATISASLKGVETVKCVDIEAVIYLGGDIDVAPFAPPGSIELAENVRDSIGLKAGVLLANHGAIGVGMDMKDALLACDNVERNSMLFVNILAAGELNPMSDEYLESGAERSLKKRGVVLV